MNNPDAEVEKKDKIEVIPEPNEKRGKFLLLFREISEKKTNFRGYE